MYTLTKNANTGELVGGTASLQFTTTAGTDVQAPTKTSKVLIKDSRQATQLQQVIIRTQSATILSISIVFV